MGFFDGDYATYILYAAALALVGFLIYVLIFRKSGKTAKPANKKDAYEEEAYEEEDYEEEDYEEEDYEEEDYEEEDYEEEDFEDEDYQDGAEAYEQDEE